MRHDEVGGETNKAGKLCSSGWTARRLFASRPGASADPKATLTRGTAGTDHMGGLRLSTVLGGPSPRPAGSLS